MAFDSTPYVSWEARLSADVQRWRSRLLLEPGLKATIDFETRSAADLRKVGAWLYSKHPTTQAMCLAFKLPGQADVGFWHMAHPDLFIGESNAPLDLFAFIVAGGLTEAHNSFFERCIWKHVMVDRHGWPEIRHEQWRCSAAKASAAALPRDLDGACEAQNLVQKKDRRGKYLIQKLCKPRKPRKAEVQEWLASEDGQANLRRLRVDRLSADEARALMPIAFYEEEEDILDFWEYCKQDVRAEEEFSHVTRDLTADELLVWQMDQWMNWRGTRFDVDFARKALAMAARYKAKLNRELESMTGITSATQRAAVKDWLHSWEGVDLPDTKASTVDWYLKRVEMSGRARRMLEILKQVNKTSINKYKAILNFVDPDDGRARDLLMYHGASTGRWTGKGIQVHNFPRGSTVNSWYELDGKEFGKLDMDLLCEAILTEDLEWVEMLHGDVMEALSTALRGSLIPSEDMSLMVADYAAIEARCVLWEAGAESALDVFRRGEDIYCDMATGIYGYKVEKKKHPEERQFGKQAILGLGYGMGYLTFFLTCRKYDIVFSRTQVLKIMGPERLAKYESWVRKQLDVSITESEDPKKNAAARAQARMNRRRLIEEREDPDAVTHELALMKYTVDVYRSRYPEVKDMWKAQEQAAISAVQQKGQRFVCGKVTWFCEGGFLYCELPSGRCLSYASPEIKLVQTSWGESRPALRYMSIVKGTKWARTATYGGKIVENITQAVARDVMADAMVNAYKQVVYADEWETSFRARYFPLISVHDELVCEVPEEDLARLREGNSKGHLRDFESLMSSVRSWADGCPIVAEADCFKRYRK